MAWNHDPLILQYILTYNWFIRLNTICLELASFYCLIIMDDWQTEMILRFLNALCT